MEQAGTMEMVIALLGMFLETALVEKLSFLTEQTPNFRDWSVPSFYFNISDNFFSLPYVEKNAFNYLTNFFTPNVIVLIYSLIWVFFGFFAAFIALPKINSLVFGDFHKKTNQSHFLSLSFKRLEYIFISVFYVLNYWTAERLLMGQVNILRGHLLFPIGVYLWLTVQSNNEKESQGEKYKQILIFSLFSLFLSFVSVHYFLFLIYGILLHRLIYLFHTSFLSIKSKNLSILKNATISNIKLKLTGLLFFVLITVFNIYQIYSTNVETSKLLFSIPLEDKSKMIEAFSLSVLSYRGLTNVFLQGVIGAGSWMNNNFIEIVNVEEVLDSVYYFKFFFAYFSPISAIVFTGLICFVIIIVYKFTNAKALVNSKLLQIWLGVFTLLALVSNFGYSFILFYPVNFVTNNIFPSIILRESGKWYSVFVMLISVFFISALQIKGIRSFSGKIIRFLLIVFILTQVVFSFLVVKSLSLSDNSLSKKINVICEELKIKERKNGEDVKITGVSFPFQTYIQTSQSKEVFIEDGLFTSSRCNFLRSNYSTVGENIVISDSDTDKILRQFNYFNQSQCNISNILNTLERFKIRIIVTNFYIYPSIEALSTCLDNYVDKSLDNNIIIYRKVNESDTKVYILNYPLN